MLALGLGIDTMNMTRTRSQIQDALDAAAMQIAINVNSGRSDAELEALGNAFLKANVDAGDHDISGLSLRYLGMSEANGIQSLSAEATYDYTYLVPRTFGDGAASETSLHFDARISSSIGDGACIYALNHTAPRAIEAAGNTSVTVDGCVLASNSTAMDSIYVGGSATVRADCLQAAGHIEADGGLVTDCVQNRERAWRLPNPFADIQEPMAPMLLTNPHRNDVSVGPGRYRNLTLDGTKTLEPGLYYIEGSLSIKGTISGEGITFFMLDGAISVNGSASLSISAPQSGAHAGMLFWSAEGNTSSHVFNGNGATDLDGYLYFPDGSVDYLGNNGTTSNCLRIVADTITLSGSSTMRSDCADELGGREAKVAGPLYFSR